MTFQSRWRVGLIAVCGVAASCAGDAPGSRTDVSGSDSQPANVCDAAAARTIVEQLGQRLKQVSLLAPDSIVVREIRRSYAPLVTPALLDAWTSTPIRAPGRKVSSPWPERIDITSVDTVPSGSCRVRGAVVYVATAERGASDVVSREPVTLQVVHSGREWRITSYDETRAGAPDPSTSAAGDAVAVVDRYYAAINDRDFGRAYVLWENGGAASGKTRREFAAGFAHTRRVQVETGPASRVEPAAGSRYVEVPVVLRAVDDDGTEQRFQGKYVLRRSVVDGASAADREWHIYSADITRSQ